MHQCYYSIQAKKPMEEKKSKHRLNVLAALIFSLVSLFGFINDANTQARKPNIIFILGDDVGYQSLNCDGGNLYSTPFIDTMAQQGMRFTQCQATPMCSPSRHMLLTGKYNFRNYYKWGYMDATEKTFGNMMRDAGYKTGFFGKEQLGGDRSALNSWGFDNYCVYHITVGSPAGSKYKDPLLYTHGAFLPDAATLNKYGPDIISDSVLSFIERNKSKPFFIYYPLMLVHTPFAPTPDDPEFAGWDPGNPSDTSFFGSMMHYMDKKVGEVITKLQSLGIDKNTIIFFSGDNGTSGEVPVGDDDDSIVFGGKKSTTENGTHVPLIAYWPGTITAGTVNNDLVDFTDFLPTFAGIANVPIPSYYDKLDGVDFSPRLTGQAGTPRDWIFCDFNFKPGSSLLYRWAQTDAYKLYDTSARKPQLFYNLIKDVNERHPIADDKLTSQEIKIKRMLLNVITNHVKQGKPLIALSPSLALLSDSSVIVEDTIRTNGGSTITASGAVWSASPNPTISSSDHRSTGVMWGPFSPSITGLMPNTTYFLKTYATNYAGTAYSEQVKFKTLGPPVAIPATAITDTGFTANWKDFPGATSYRLDISTSLAFTQFVQEYNGLFVKSNSKKVTGLMPATRYYYRVRAVTKGITTGNSNIMAVTTGVTGRTSTGSSDLQLAKDDDTFNVEVFPNPTSDAFSINVQSTSNSNIQIIITDINGKKLYETSGNNFSNYVIGKQLSPGVYFIKVMQEQNIKTIKLIKEK
jgi:arylsulfatase A-like enzyme